MISPRRPLAMLLSLILISFGQGCSSKPRPVQPGECTSSDRALVHFVAARTVYEDLQIRDARNPQFADGVHLALQKLKDAMAVDRTNPLFYSQSGNLLLQIGQLDEARAMFERSLGTATGSDAGSQDWVPGWIGLAQVATRRGNLEELKRNLDQAVGALRALDGQDPRLPMDVRSNLLNAIAAGESWAIDVPPGNDIRGGFAVKDRLAAQIMYLSLATTAGGAPESLRPVLDAYPDAFEPRLDQAGRLTDAGRFAEVAAVLEPWLATQNPKITNNAYVLYLCGNANTREFEQTGERGRNAAAAAELGLLLRLHPWHAPGALAEARRRAHAMTLGLSADDPSRIAVELSRIEDELIPAWSKGPLGHTTPALRDDLANLRKRLLPKDGPK